MQKATLTASTTLMMALLVVGISPVNAYQFNDDVLTAGVDCRFENLVVPATVKQTCLTLKAFDLDVAALAKVRGGDWDGPEAPPLPDPDFSAIRDLAPGGYTTYSCLTWLCAYASAHKDQEHDVPGDDPVTKLAAGGAISQHPTFDGRADIKTNFGSGFCTWDPTPPAGEHASSGCGLTWSEVDFSCSKRVWAESTAYDLLMHPPPAHAQDEIC